MYIFSGTLKKGGLKSRLKSIFFPSALKKGVYTVEPTHHLHIRVPPGRNINSANELHGNQQGRLH